MIVQIAVEHVKKAEEVQRTSLAQNTMTCDSIVDEPKSAPGETRTPDFGIAQPISHSLSTYKYHTLTTELQELGRAPFALYHGYVVK